jgi:hypothetical protein
MNRLGPFALAFVLLSSLVLAPACSGGGGGGSAGAGGGTGGGAGAGGGTQAVPCDGAPAELDLSGTWALQGRLAVTLQGTPGGAITICPADQVGESTMLLMLTMSRDPADPQKLASVDAALCVMELPVLTALVGSCDPQSESLVSTQITVPKTLRDALPLLPTSPVSGALGGLAAGASVAIERFTITIGSSQTGAALPSWDASAGPCTATNLGRTDLCEAMCVDDCAGLRDDDADGYPAVTVEVCGKTPSDVSSGVKCNAQTPDVPGTTLQGRAFLDMEVNPKLDGAAKSACEIEGTIDSAVLYNLVGADIYLAGTQIGVTSGLKSLPAFEVHPADSRFRMVRIDGQFGAPDWNVDPTKRAEACATLLSRVNEL